LLVAHRGQPFSVSEVKQLMLQLLEGIAYLHENWTLHRGASRPLLLAMPLAS
jgi:cell division cycle 2-like protein